MPEMRGERLEDCLKIPRMTREEAHHLVDVIERSMHPEGFNYAAGVREIIAMCVPADREPTPHELRVAFFTGLFKGASDDICGVPVEFHPVVIQHLRKQAEEVP